MIIISSLKHNTFKQVEVPTARDLFARVGQRVAPASSFSGEESLDPSTSKIDAVKNVIKEDVEDIPVK